MLVRMCFVNLFFICVMLLSDCDWVKWALWKDEERSYMVLATENIQGREDSRDCNGRQAGGYMERVTTRICELVDQAERLRGTDSRHASHRKDRKKNFKEDKGDELEFPQFASH